MKRAQIRSEAFWRTPARRVIESMSNKGASLRASQALTRDNQSLKKNTCGSTAIFQVLGVSAIQPGVKLGFTAVEHTEQFQAGHRKSMTFLRMAIVGLTFSLFSSWASNGHASDYIKAFGHDVRVSGKYPERALTVDDRIFLRDAIISLGEIAVVDSTPVIIGTTSAGGNACEETPFVLSFPMNGAPRLDGPIETCAIVKYEKKDTQYEFWVDAIPGRDGQRWVWTPEKGLSAPSSSSFAANKSKGWINLRERTLVHPSNVMGYSEIAEQIETLLGADKKQFLEIITGVGGGSFKGDDYVGSTCAPHMCGDIEALVFLFFSQKKPYLAWKPENQKIVVRPHISEWPEKAKTELRIWSQKWR